MGKTDKVYNLIQYNFNDPKKTGYCRPREFEYENELYEPVIEDGFPVYRNVPMQMARDLAGSHPDRFRLFNCDSVVGRRYEKGALRYIKVDVYNYVMENKYVGADNRGDDIYEKRARFFIVASKMSCFEKPKAEALEQAKVVEEIKIVEETKVVEQEPKEFIQKTKNQILREAKDECLRDGVSEDSIKDVERKFRGEIKKPFGALSAGENISLIKLLKKAVSDNGTVK